ncbi:MAG: lytic murein transglycosylase B [Aestuariibacter sp.]
MLKQLMAGCCACALIANNVCAKTAQDIDASIDEFIQRAAEETNFTAAEVQSILAQANKNQQILDAIARPWEAKPWFQYYPIFLTETRIEKGIAFWQEHELTLNKAETTFGVPAHVITAIIGVETFYGTYKGKYPVLDALYSLGFYYPPRSAFFKKELLEYLHLVDEEKLTPTAINGSYAGAMGWGQFISSSYRHYAVDFDGDGIRDLLNNPQDAIGSVANYFAKHKWQSGQPVIFKANFTPQAAALLEDGLSYSHTWQQLADVGVTLKDTNFTPNSQQAAKLFAFDLEDGKEYWVGFDNFYVITRYNHSPLYAMVVHQLSEAIKAKRETR